AEALVWELHAVPPAAQPRRRVLRQTVGALLRLGLLLMAVSAAASQAEQRPLQLEKHVAAVGGEQTVLGLPRELPDALALVGGQRRQAALQERRPVRRLAGRRCRAGDEVPGALQQGPADDGGRLAAARVRHPPVARRPGRER